MKILRLLIALKHSFKGFKGQKALFKPFDIFLMYLVVAHKAIWHGADAIDEFLFVSCVMVAKKVHTSPSIKDLIVATAGIDDSQWEDTYVKDTSGIITVCCELGEPIHKANNRALRLWKECNNIMFKLPCEKHGAWL